MIRNAVRELPDEILYSQELLEYLIGFSRYNLKGLSVEYLIETLRWGLGPTRFAFLENINEYEPSSEDESVKWLCTLLRQHFSDSERH